MFIVGLSGESGFDASSLDVALESVILNVATPLIWLNGEKIEKKRKKIYGNNIRYVCFLRTFVQKFLPRKKKAYNYNGKIEINTIKPFFKGKQYCFHFNITTTKRNYKKKTLKKCGNSKNSQIVAFIL